MSDFEQTKRTIGGRSVMITSWYDESRKSWRASAPAYSYLASLITANPTACSSRHAAVERLSGLLTSYFNNQR